MTVIRGYFTDYWQNKVLDTSLRGVNLTSPTLVLGLARNFANRAGTVSEVSSSGTGYARQSLATSVFAGAAGGATSNTQPINFAAPSADWGTVRSLFLYDTSASKVIAMADLAVPETVLAGEAPVTFATGAINISRS